MQILCLWGTSFNNNKKDGGNKAFPRANSKFEILFVGQGRECHSIVGTAKIIDLSSLLKL